jgi:hypothetical protein
LAKSVAIHLTTMESVSKTWQEYDRAPVKGVMAGPEGSSQGKIDLGREIHLVFKAVRKAVSKISDIKSKVPEI